MLYIKGKKKKRVPMCLWNGQKKERSNKEEEEQKGAVLCAQHIRGAAAGQSLDSGGLPPHALVWSTTREY